MDTRQVKGVHVGQIIVLNRVKLQNESKVPETAQKKMETAMCCVPKDSPTRCHKLTFHIYGNTLPHPHYFVKIGFRIFIILKQSVSIR